MYSFEEYDADDEVHKYQRSIRDRANDSINELKESLHATPRRNLSPPRSAKSPTHGSARHGSPIKAKDDLIKAVHPRTLTWHDLENRPPKYRDAAQQLRQMLQDKEVPEKENSIPRGPLPTAEEAAQILQNQVGYTNQLEAENRYIKEELAVLQLKLSEILEENKNLHQELKTTVIHEIIREGGDINKLTGALDDVVKDVINTGMSRTDYKRWQIELERLSSLHAAKTERLETQLLHARNEVHKYEQTVEDLKSQIRMHDTIPTHENGLIVNTFLSDTQRNFHQQAIDRITKERDELMEHCMSLKTRLTDMTRREEEAYQQMKKGIELVEQAQLEQTEALVQKEQFADELSNMRDRFEAHVTDTHRKMEMERQSARNENKAIIDDLNKKLKEVTEHYTVLQHEMERTERQKTSLSNELDEIKAELRKCDREVTMMSEMYRTETTSTSIHRSTAVQDAAKMRCQLDQLHKQNDEEKSRKKTEIDELRRRLNTAERELVNAKEECIHLTTNTQALERELHLAKLSRHSVEQGRSEDMKAVSKQAKQRENELNSVIAEMEDKNSQVHAEMDTMLNKQNRLILKLRDECRKQATQLDKMTKKHRSEVGKLSRENEEMRLRLERSVARLSTLDDQSDQHAQVHDKMSERLKMMDEHAQHQSQQLIQILAKQTRLMRDRQLLARELDFLRSQIGQLDKYNTVKLSSSCVALVNEILDGISKEERLGGGLTIDSEFIRPTASSDQVDIDELM
ncbi:serologically defined colon cancer antigen 8 homolog [Patella vulgata]|uniref:serologically defined colon cancer antigen 8 homolog n=1 Tax=Patella vulgata TaxID=6465 RepID=UPI0024A95511|nr:serologically defined colon cancer antigen 8 homolog [Patella vulgata]